MDKVILAFKGDLNSSLCILWLKHKENMSVHTLLMYFGGEVDKQAMCETAIDLGATRADVLDVRETFAREFVFPALRASADFHQGAFLGPALARPLIARELVRIANDENCRFVAHGSPQSDNEHLRYDACFSVLKPELECLTPFELFTPQFVETQKERVEKIRERHSLPPLINYYYCESLWSRCVHSPEIDNLNEPIPEEFYTITRNPQKAPDKERIFEISFENGNPVAVDGKKMDPVELLATISKIGAEHGVGRFDMLDPGIIGIKTRMAVESPAAAILFPAHRALEEAVLDEFTLTLQRDISRHYRDLLYHGNWFNPAREALDAFFNRTQQEVTGEVRLRVFKGQCSILSRVAPFSLYQASRTVDHNNMLREYTAINNFVRLRNLTLRAAAKLKSENQE